MNKPSDFPKFTNITTNDASLVNRAFDKIWSGMEALDSLLLENEDDEKYIDGSEKTLKWYSFDGGKSVDLLSLQSGNWVATGWYIIVGVVAGSGAAGFGTFQQVTAHWAFKENPDGSLGFYETTDGGITWVGPKSTIRK
jgi:hypothetical protein